MRPLHSTICLFGALACAPALSLAQPVGGIQQFNIEQLWEVAFDRDYVEGDSAIVLGEQLSSGAIEVFVYDPNNPGPWPDQLLQPGGQFYPYGDFLLTWLPETEMASYNAAKSNAYAAYNACMQNCGYVIGNP